ncbi:unnamed protein product [Acanthosepion pharaonis]|uniref:Uncharacterized protein n=1 Tax=Acanthosepion pharaonis TaxID=158019 RepID=A0A812CFR1_ACAPH|nr:unnamed protein product [Sepia pharaonis]
MISAIERSMSLFFLCYYYALSTHGICSSLSQWKVVNSLSEVIRSIVRPGNGHMYAVTKFFCLFKIHLKRFILLNKQGNVFPFVKATRFRIFLLFPFPFFLSFFISFSFSVDVSILSIFVSFFFYSLMTVSLFLLHILHNSYCSFKRFFYIPFFYLISSNFLFLCIIILQVSFYLRPFSSLLPYFPSVLTLAEHRHFPVHFPFRHHFLLVPSFTSFRPHHFPCIFLFNTSSSFYNGHSISLNQSFSFDLLLGPLIRLFLYVFLYFFSLPRPSF